MVPAPLLALTQKQAPGHAKACPMLASDAASSHEALFLQISASVVRGTAQPRS